MATCIDNCRAYTYKRSSEFSSSFSSPHLSSTYDDNDDGEDEIWSKIREEAESDAAEEPILQGYYFNLILSQTPTHPSSPPSRTTSPASSA